MTVNSWQNSTFEWIKISVHGSLSRSGLRETIDEWRGDQAVDKGFRQVELESDNALLIEVLQTRLTKVNNVVEIQMINNLYSRDWKNPTDECLRIDDSDIFRYELPNNVKKPPRN
ncbi:hypothetical protein Golob_007214, partial [Gossypium lobatum]|nr:hypothetical protein [Gossypium lobatum]